MTVLMVTKKHYKYMLKHQVGVCTNCGQHHYGIPRDSENLECFCCKSNSVYCPSKLLLSGKLDTL